MFVGCSKLTWNRVDEKKFIGSSLLGSELFLILRDTSANNACQNYYICASNLSVLRKINVRKAAVVIIVLPNIVALFYPKTLITTIHLGSPWQ